MRFLILFLFTSIILTERIVSQEVAFTLDTIIASSSDASEGTVGFTAVTTPNAKHGFSSNDDVIACFGRFHIGAEACSNLFFIQGDNVIHTDFSEPLEIEKDQFHQVGDDFYFIAKNKLYLLNTDMTENEMYDFGTNHPRWLRINEYGFIAYPAYNNGNYELLHIDVSGSSPSVVGMGQFMNLQIGGAIRGGVISDDEIVFISEWEGIRFFSFNPDNPANNATAFLSAPDPSPIVSGISAINFGLNIFDGRYLYYTGISGGNLAVVDLSDKTGYLVEADNIHKIFEDGQGGIVVGVENGVIDGMGGYDLLHIKNGMVSKASFFIGMFSDANPLLYDNQTTHRFISLGEDRIMLYADRIWGGGELIGDRGIYRIIRHEETSTSTTEEQIFRFRAYPNPTTDMVRISGLPNGGKTLTIFDMTGKQLLCGVFHNTTERIDFSHFPLGIYLVRVDTEERSHTEKIIKR